jgi:hypothetical protein
MLTLIMVAVASLVSFFWLGPWCMVLLGGKAFFATLALLAVLVGWFGLWWYLIPLCLAYLGSMITASWFSRRS